MSLSKECRPWGSWRPAQSLNTQIVARRWALKAPSGARCHFSGVGVVRKADLGGFLAWAATDRVKTIPFLPPPLALQPPAPHPRTLRNPRTLKACPAHVASQAAMNERLAPTHWRRANRSRRREPATPRPVSRHRSILRTLIGCVWGRYPFNTTARSQADTVGARFGLDRRPARAFRREVWNDALATIINGAPGACQCCNLRAPNSFKSPTPMPRLDALSRASRRGLLINTEGWRTFKAYAELYLRVEFSN